MPYQLNGFWGIIISVALFLVVWFFVWLGKIKQKGPFAFDPKGEPGAFEKLLQIYLDIMKFLLGLASGSIVLLVGSSALRESELLPAEFASPLFILAASILYGLLLMVFLTTNYESYRHGTVDYSKFMYTRNLALGFSSLLSFCIGYIWLIYVVTL